MNKFKLNYGSKLQVALDMDIEIFRYKSIFDICDKVAEILYNSDKKTIFLFTYDYISLYNNHIIITANINPILDFVKNMKETKQVPAMDDNNFFLQEYKSWEDAYSVALMMREGSPICYRQDN